MEFKVGDVLKLQDPRDKRYFIIMKIYFNEDNTLVELKDISKDYHFIITLSLLNSYYTVVDNPKAKLIGILYGV